VHCFVSINYKYEHCMDNICINLQHLFYKLLYYFPFKIVTTKSVPPPQEAKLSIVLYNISRPKITYLVIFLEVSRVSIA
jgi:hypothetical protein